MTVTATRSPFYLQVRGVWKQLEGVVPGVAVVPDRPSSEFRSLGNVRYVQVAAKVVRTWGLSFVWEDAEASRWLDYAASNPSEVVWFWDTNLAQINCLDPADTKGASATLVTVDGIPMPAFVALDGFTQKLRGGVTYYLSYTTTHTAATTIGTYNIGAGVVNIVSPAGSGARRGSVSFTPAAAVDAVVSWTVADKTSGARLTEGTVDTLGFLEGRDTPCRVSVSDGASTYNRSSTTALPWADTSYVVSEVG